MYSAVFERSDGKRFVFGTKGGNIFDMDVGKGMAVNLGLSQGFSQIGQSVETSSVAGRTITVTGTFVPNLGSNVAEDKKRMRSVLTPFAKGRLIFNGKQYTNVFVKNAPSFSPVKDNGKFTMQLFAPFPFFYSQTQTSIYIGGMVGRFSFPVNYAEPHFFGVSDKNKYQNITNNGDVPVPFRVTLSTNVESVNPVVTNLKTFQSMRINGRLNAGDFLDIYRNDENVLRAELTSDGVVSDVLSWIDEDSDLFSVDVGDNLISASDENNGLNLSVRVTFNEAVVAVYED